MRVAAVLVAVALIASVVAVVATPSSAAPAGSRYSAEYFSNFEVTDHHGETYRFYDDLIKDKFVVVNFIYLNCIDICPLSTSRLAEIVGRLGDAVGRDVAVYSITMDPENDSLELLKSFADAFDAPSGWKFLTGRPDQLAHIRWRLGERSRKLSEHRNDLLLGNDPRGSWHRLSLMSDLDNIVESIRNIDPRLAAMVTPRAARTARAIGDDPRSFRLDNTPGQALFLKACSTCHTVGGGDRIGPDLTDIETRRGRGWLTRFLAEPEKLRAEGDPTVLAVDAQYPGVRMPDLGLEVADIEDLLVYLRSQDRAGEARAGGAEDRTTAR